MNINRP